MRPQKKPFEEARGELEPFLKTQPQNFALLEDLALTSAAQGDATAAFAFVERAISREPNGEGCHVWSFSIGDSRASVSAIG